MSRGSRPTTDADRASVAPDAEALLGWLRVHARAGNGAYRTLVATRARIADALGLTLRRERRAEDALLRERRVQVRRLLPRDEPDAVPGAFRYLLPPTDDRPFPPAEGRRR